MTGCIEPVSAHVDLYWLPLGAGGHCVKWNGRLFEALTAAAQRRPRLDLYHSALAVTSVSGHHVIELAPVPDGWGGRRGVTVQGPVGTRWLGWSRWFRYEVRCWPGGVIPDLAEAIQSPRIVGSGECFTQRVLRLAGEVPSLVWGQDESGTGEMWNSNSVTSWLLQRAGADTAAIRPPDGGRAPGWQAGIAVARRQGCAVAVGPCALPGTVPRRDDRGQAPVAR